MQPNLMVPAIQGPFTTSATHDQLRFTDINLALLQDTGVRARLL